MLLIKSKRLVFYMNDTFIHGPGGSFDTQHCIAALQLLGVALLLPWACAQG